MLSGGRRQAWRWLVPVVCLVAGLVFATSATTSGGTELRAPGIASLADTVRAAEQKVHGDDHRVTALQKQVDRAATATGRRDTGVGRALGRVAPLRAAGGLSAVHGAGLEVVLDDAPSDDPQDSGVDPNQLLIHQSDMQSVVNALWTGGAQAMTVAGQRIIATSAVRCVGNTLLLNGEVYSPPYRIDAIGPASALQDALAASPGVRFLVQAADYYGLGYTVATESSLSLPAYDGPIGLVYAHAGR